MITNNNRYKLQELESNIKNGVFDKNISDMFEYFLYNIEFKNIKNFIQSNKTTYVYFSEDLQNMYFGSIKDFDIVSQFAPISINLFGHNSKLNDICNKIYSDAFNEASKPFTIAKNLVLSPYEDNENIPNTVYDAIQSSYKNISLNKNVLSNENEEVIEIIKKEILKSLKIKVNALIKMDESNNFSVMREENERFSDVSVGYGKKISGKERLVYLKTLTNEETIQKYPEIIKSSRSYATVISKYQILKYNRTKILTEKQVNDFIEIVNSQNGYSYMLSDCESNYAYILSDFFKRNNDFTLLLSKVNASCWTAMFKSLSLDEKIEAINDFEKSKYYDDKSQYSKMIKVMNSLSFNISSISDNVIVRLKNAFNLLEKIAIPVDVAFSLRVSQLATVASNPEAIELIEQISKKHHAKLHLTFDDDSLLSSNDYKNKINTNMTVENVKKFLYNKNLDILSRKDKFSAETISSGRLHYFDDSMFEDMFKNKTHNNFYVINFFKLINDFIISSKRVDDLDQTLVFESIL